ncbi:DUF1622 domain-containing protein [uncultured Christiangramia sp.]|uniref:DUF1622 domain-containing protein n=1 Tax=uncultured Christiangramia sp. TaxID=503836 RepID=UPI00260FF3D4|nr:DUF1622 domain-containing protein [uncultured Christiangramia sp.]
MENISLYIEYAAKFIEITGVAVILLGTIVALFKYILAKQGDGIRSYKLLRQELGKAILLGLEILVAADIIATVVTKPTLDEVISLGIIVLIRTFLSLSIELEIEGRFPWQRKEKENRLDQEA